MKSILIDNSNCTLYKTFKDLYTTSFPIFEQRTDEQQKNAFEKDNYYLISYLDENKFVGFISYWDFNTYVYIEHFAVNTEIRGKGYGSKILELFKISVNKPVILEIDPIKDETSKARLRFYIKNGFYENIYNHQHPVYREGFKPHELIIMTTKRPLSVKEYLGFKSNLDKVVMGNYQYMTTQRLILRPWIEADAEALYKYAKDPAIGPIAGWPPHTSIENSKDVICDILSAPETYAVVLKETNEPIGSVGIMFGNGVHSADIQEGDAEIGYWIGVPYWGQGLIPEAVNRLLKRCFDELDIKRVWCGYYDGNTKSRRVMDKCGFKYHHTEEGKTSPLGDKRTEHFTLLTKDDWNKK